MWLMDLFVLLNCTDKKTYFWCTGIYFVQEGRIILPVEHKKKIRGKIFTHMLFLWMANLGMCSNFYALLFRNRSPESIWHGGNKSLLWAVNLAKNITGIGNILVKKVQRFWSTILNTATCYVIKYNVFYITLKPVVIFRMTSHFMNKTHLFLDSKIPPVLSEK